MISAPKQRFRTHQPGPEGSTAEAPGGPAEPRRGGLGSPRAGAGAGWPTCGGSLASETRFLKSKFRKSWFATQIACHGASPGPQGRPLGPREGLQSHSALVWARPWAVRGGVSRLRRISGPKNTAIHLKMSQKHSALPPLVRRRLTQALPGAPRAVSGKFTMRSIRKLRFSGQTPPAGGPPRTGRGPVQLKVAPPQPRSHCSRPGDRPSRPSGAA